MRTSSQTLPYWMFDVELFDDPKIVDLNDKYGPLGKDVFFETLSLIAKTEGYFALFSEQLILSIYRNIGSKWIKSRAVVAEVIHYCGVCGLFDVNLLTQNVITSRGIQRRWLYAKQKSRARGYSTAKYWLLDQNEPVRPILYNNQNTCSKKDDTCSNNSDNCNNNTPYKVSKGKVSKNTPQTPLGGGKDPVFAELSGTDLSFRLEEKMQEWLRYKSERREGYKPQGLRSLLCHVQRMTQQHGEEAVCAVIDLSMANNWQGIVWDKLTERKTVPQRKTTQGVDYSGECDL